MRVLLILTIIAILAYNASAQVFLQKTVIANAGGRTANATTRLDYTVGETAVGVASNGITKGQFGFWYASSFLSSVKSNTGAIKDVAVRPNPASNFITLTIELSTGGNLDLLLYDAAGHLISTLYSGKKAPGLHTLRYDTQTLATGTYFIAALVPGALVQERLTIVR